MKNRVGQTFGRLTVIEYAGKDNFHHSRWLCKCECGNKKIISSHSLTSGTTVSCGCYNKEIIKKQKSNLRHGFWGTKIYTDWKAMKQRCANSKSRSYQWYGARGIKVCDEWKNDFMSFYNHVSKLPHFGEDGYSLDRINNDGNYEPGNVRWATAKEQIHNRRRLS